MKINLLIYRFILFFAIMAVLRFDAFTRGTEEKTDSGILFIEECSQIYNQLGKTGLNRTLFLLSMQGYKQVKSKGLLQNDTILTIVDYSLKSDTERFYVIDIKNRIVLFETFAAHGKKSGLNYARRFSNTLHSNKSSLGFYVTSDTYMGKHGYSIRIDGIEPSNNNARIRGIVIHGADYVSKTFIEKNGRLGRSFGCPAIPIDLTEPIIECIKNQSCLFIYSPDHEYQATSTIFN